MASKYRTIDYLCSCVSKLGAGGSAKFLAEVVAGWKRDEHKGHNLKELSDED